MDGPVLLKTGQTCGFHCVAVITSALHAEGPGFEPQWNHVLRKDVFVVTLLCV